MAVSPILRKQATYPFLRLNQAAAARRARGLEVIDLGIGDPREPTDPRIIEALKEGVRDSMGYPPTAGLPELRQAIARWAKKRFQVDLDPERAVIPTLGSKEAIYSFAQVVLDLDAGRDTVVITEPGYPVYERGALFAGASVLELPLREERGFLPDLDAVSSYDWRRAALVWVNYPNNPTCVTAPMTFYERLAELSRQHGFVIASDEAYSELWFEERPVSLLQLADWSNVIVLNTLSKRSSMTGFRSGFMAGDPALIEALRKFRVSIGTAPQEFVQRASVVAWSDERHVERARRAYAAKRKLFLSLFERKGVHVAGAQATMYLWVATPGGENSEAFATRMLEHGIVVTPGSFLGRSGEGYIRLALAPTHDECVRAVEIMEDVL
jgi:acetylornithine aminotransferase